MVASSLQRGRPTRFSAVYEPHRENCWVLFQASRVLLAWIKQCRVLCFLACQNLGSYSFDDLNDMPFTTLLSMPIAEQ